MHPYAFKLDFIPLPLGTGYHYILVCMFSGWGEAFPHCKADALTVAKTLLENMFPTWDMPSKCSLKVFHSLITHYGTVAEDLSQLSFPTSVKLFILMT